MAHQRDELRRRADAGRRAEIAPSLQWSLVLKRSKELARGKGSFAQHRLPGTLAPQDPLTISEIAQRMGPRAGGWTAWRSSASNLLKMMAHLDSTEQKRRVKIDEKIATCCQNQ